MQSNFRRYLVLGGVGLALLLIIVFTLSLGGGKGSAESTCNKFIDYIIAQDAENSYAMFSANPQREMTRESWKKTMQVMQPSHYEATYKLESTNDLTPESSSEDPEPATLLQLNYTVSSPPITVDASCHVIDTDDGLKIDAYTISPREQQQEAGN